MQYQFMGGGIDQAWPSCRHFGALQLWAGGRTAAEGFVLCWTDIGCNTGALTENYLALPKPQSFWRRILIKTAGKLHRATRRKIRSGGFLRGLLQIQAV